jgi:hypothetical protein
MKSREYFPLERENDQIYLIRQAEEMDYLYRNQKNTNAIIYACLDCRIALEKTDLDIICLSVPEEEHEEIIYGSIPHKGIPRVDRKVGVLKLKYQQFFQAVTELVGFETKAYDFKKSLELQGMFSKYIHSYWAQPVHLEYKSDYLENASKIIQDCKKFIMDSMVLINGERNLLGLDVRVMPEEDKALLTRWKGGNKMTYEELKNQLRTNIQNRS